MAANAANVVKHVHLKDLQQHVQSLLTEQEKYYFSYVLKDYRTYKSVEKLVRSLVTCLNTPAKQQLLKDVRNFVLPSQVTKYDTLVQQISTNNAEQSSTSPRSDSVDVNGRQKFSNLGKYRVINLINDKVNNTDLGFTICGGKEFGVGIHVCKVARNLPAFNAGLLENDHLIEVNGISLQNIPLVSAGNLLVSLNKLKLVVKKENSADSFNHMVELNPWAEAINKAPDNAVDQLNESKDQSSLSDHGSYQFQSSNNGSQENTPRNNDLVKMPTVTMRRNSSILNADNTNNERRINLIVESNDDEFIGFNIRGGCEYGLGIYVSSVDIGSLAERCGIRIGDQILDANGTNFENILHKNAVDFLKSNKNLILTVKAVGKIPDEKCYIEEYSWLAPDGSTIADAKKTEYLSSSMPVPQSRDLRDFATDAAELPWNQTINLPTGAFKFDAENIDESVQVNADADAMDGQNIPQLIIQPVTAAPDSNAKDDEDVQLRRSPSANSLVSKKSSDSGKSDRGTKSSVYSGEHSDSDRSREDLSNLLSTSKAKRSKSFLQKQSDKIRAKFSLRLKKKSAKQSLFDSETFSKSNNTHEWVQYIDNKAKERLSVNDYNALMIHIKHYLEKGDIEIFTSNLLEILDTAGKALLLKDIRTVVFPYDIGRFDARIAKREMDNMIALGRDPIESPILDVELSEKPPKKTLVTAVQDKGGKFQLKSKKEAERLEKEKQENSKRMSKKYIQQRSILERESTIQRYKSFSNVPRPSKEHTQSWGHDPDEVDKDLDYIPTKDVTDYHYELYAKVDKTLKTVQKAEVKSESQKPIINVENEEKLKRSMTTMSDIDEDQEYPVPDIRIETSSNNHADQNGRIKKNDHVIDEEDDDDDYTPINLIERKPEGRKITVSILKKSKTLGISISGGKGSTQQPEIRIERIYPGGAFAEAGSIKAGYQILSVDGESLHDATHNEAVDLIRRSYNNKSKPTMDIVALAS